MLCQAKFNFPGRVHLSRFENFQLDPSLFWKSLIEFFDLPILDKAKENTRSETINKKPFGYQIGPASSWTAKEQDYLHESQYIIDELVSYDL